MATSSDRKQAEDDVFDAKNHALQIEAISPQPEDSQSAWQCIRANPKISLWTLWANSEQNFPFSWTSQFLTPRSRLHHDRLREPRPLRMPSYASLPVRDTPRKKPTLLNLQLTLGQNDFRLGNRWCHAHTSALAIAMERYVQRYDNCWVRRSGPHSRLVWSPRDIPNVHRGFFIWNCSGIHLGNTSHVLGW